MVRILFFILRLSCDTRDVFVRAHVPMAEASDLATAHAEPIAKTSWFEVPQAGLFKLGLRGDVHFVEHTHTGESRDLATGGKWYSAITRDHRVIAATDDTEKPVWMSSLFRGALWSYEDRLLVWLDKMQKKFTIDSLKIEVFMKEFGLKTLSPKIYIFSTPRAGARVFVELDEFESMAGTGTSQDFSSFFRNSFSHLC